MKNEILLFIRETFPQFDSIQYGRQTFSYVLVQVTVNAPLVRVKLLRAVNENPDSYSCLCECNLSLSATICTFDKPIAVK